MLDKRILWIDWIKFLAIFGVIGIHTSSSLLDSEFLFTFTWYEAVFSASLFRFAIILFIMASGFLLLRKQQPIEVIPKRMKRILLPFIFWLIVYALVKVFVKGALGPNWNVIDLLGYIGNAFVNPMNVSVQFWYVYMILGLYLISPLLSRWIQNAPLKEVEYVLTIWLILSILEFISGKFLLLDYLRYFTGAIGYFILGHYLDVKDSPLLKNKSFGITLFVIGTLITVIGTIALSLLTNTQSLFFIRLGDITPGACLQGIGLFILVKNIDFDNLSPKINDLVVRISKDSYGIYLVNILVINIFEKLHLIDMTHFTIIKIFLVMIIVLVVSDVIIDIMGRIKFLNAFSGR